MRSFKLNPKSLFCVLTLASLAITSFSSAQTITTPQERAATKGANKILVIPPKGKPVGVKPDLLFYKDGRIIEAWDLTVKRQAVDYTYYGADDKRFERRDTKHRILAIQFGRTLQDYLKEQNQAEKPATPVVAPAKKQPVKKKEVLAGTYFAKQGRFTKWTATFTSQIHKYYTSAKNATEYGTFLIKSHMFQPTAEDKTHESEVIAKGQYFLYAPGVFGNKNWVLNLTKVSYTENDISPRASVYTERLRDEVFIVNLSKDGNVFNLEWANQEGWQWVSPTQQTFYRAKPTRTQVGSNRPHKISAENPFESIKKILGVGQLARKEE